MFDYVEGGVAPKDNVPISFEFKDKMAELSFDTLRQNAEESVVSFKQAADALNNGVNLLAEKCKSDSELQSRYGDSIKRTKELIDRIKSKASKDNLSEVSADLEEVYRWVYTSPNQTTLVQSMSDHIDSKQPDISAADRNRQISEGDTKLNIFNAKLEALEDKYLGLGQRVWKGIKAAGSAVGSAIWSVITWPINKLADLYTAMMAPPVPLTPEQTAAIEKQRNEEIANLAGVEQVQLPTTPSTQAAPKKPDRNEARKAADAAAEEGLKNNPYWEKQASEKPAKPSRDTSQRNLEGTVSSPEAGANAETAVSQKPSRPPLSDRANSLRVENRGALDKAKEAASLAAATVAASLVNDSGDGKFAKALERGRSSSTDKGRGA